MAGSRSTTPGFKPKTLAVLGQYVTKKIDPSVVAFVNLSANYERQELWEYVEESCTRALDMLPTGEDEYRPKLLLRRAKGRMGLKDKRNAEKDAQEFLSQYPNHPQAAEMAAIAGSAPPSEIVQPQAQASNPNALPIKRPTVPIKPGTQKKTVPTVDVDSVSPSPPQQRAVSNPKAKPAAKAPELKPAAKTPEPKPAAKAPEPKPAAKAPVIAKPASVSPEPKAVPAAKPAAKAPEAKPAAKTPEPKPAPPVAKPAAKAPEAKPVAKSPEPRAQSKKPLAASPSDMTGRNSPAKKETPDLKSVNSGPTQAQKNPTPNLLQNKSESNSSKATPTPPLLKTPSPLLQPGIVRKPNFPTPAEDEDSGFTMVQPGGPNNSQSEKGIRGKPPAKFSQSSKQASSSKVSKGKTPEPLKNSLVLEQNDKKAPDKNPVTSPNAQRYIQPLRPTRDVDDSFEKNVRSIVPANRPLQVPRGIEQEPAFLAINDYSQDNLFEKSQPQPKEKDIFPEIEKLIKSETIKPQQEFFLLPKEWYNLNNGGPSLDETTIMADNQNVISTSGLIDDSVAILQDPDPQHEYTNIHLNRGMAKDKDFVALPLAAWNLLKQKFICNTPVQRYGLKKNTLEVYLFQLRVVTTLGFQELWIQLPSTATLQHLQSKLCRSLSIGADAFKVWHDPNDCIDPDRLSNLKAHDGPLQLEACKELRFAQMLVSKAMKSGDRIIVESEPFEFTTTEQPLKCIWCQDYVRDPITDPDYQVVIYCSEDCKKRHSPILRANYKRKKASKKSGGASCCLAKAEEEENVTTIPQQPNANSKLGLVSIKNIGNSSYMSSVIMCLANTPPFVVYFLDNRYQHDLGDTNINIVNLTAHLFKNIWYGKNLSVNPMNFKKELGLAYPAYAGFDRMDAEPFLVSWLHVLNSGLNSLNTSVIELNFYGRLDIQRTCLKCKTLSTAEETFATLPLVIPQERHVDQEIYFMYYDNRNWPVKLTMPMGQDQTVRDVRRIVAKEVGVSKSKTMMAFVSNAQIQQVVTVNHKCIDIIKENVFMFEVPSHIPENERVMVDMKITKKNAGNLSFNRLVFFNSSYSMGDVHLHIFNYLQKYYDDFPAFAKILDFYQANKNCYTLRLVNDQKICDYCKQGGCKNCELPFTEESFVQYTNYQEGNFIRMELRWNADCPGVGLRLINKCIPKDLSSNTESLSILQPVTIEECLDKFFSNPIRSKAVTDCSVCKKQSPSDQLSKVHNLPPILVLQLERFIIEGEKKQKVFTPVKYPVKRLNLSPYVGTTQIYDLYAVVTHTGSIDEGKYQAMAQNARSKKWCRFNDTTVRPVNEDEAVSQSAYLLFYKLVKTSERAQGVLQKDGLWGVAGAD